MNKKEPIKEITTSKGLVVTVGKNYILDKEFRNSGEVKVVAIYGKLFCRVEDLECLNEWDTMINRLSKIEENEN